MSGREPCEAVRERFLDLEGGGLAPPDERRVREHIEACEACRRAWEAWQVQGRALRDALGPVRPPRDVAGAALAELHADRRQQQRARGRVLMKWGAVAAAAVLIAVGMALYRATRYERIGSVEEVVGRPQARQRGQARPGAINASDAVYNGAELVTAANEGLALRFDDGSRLVMSEGTKVQLSGTGYLAHCGHHLAHVCLLRGEVLCELKSLTYFRGVGTPLGTAIVEGTTFRVRYQGRWTLLEVLEGTVKFSCPSGEVRANAGTTWVVDSRDLMPRKVSGVFD